MSFCFDGFEDLGGRDESLGFLVSEGVCLIGCFFIESWEF